MNFLPATLNMVKTYLILVMILLAYNTSYCQLGDPQQGVSSIFKLNFLMPGVSFEQKMASYQAIYLAAYMDVLYLNANETFSGQAHFYLTPSFNAEFRNYYNINKRDRKGLRTGMNSANYIAPLYIGRYTGRFELESPVWVSQIGAVWGLQRNAPKGFSVDLNMGLVYTFHTQHYYYYGGLQPIVQLTLGFWMGEKSR